MRLHSIANFSALAWELKERYPDGAQIICSTTEIAEELATELRFFSPLANFLLPPLDIDAQLQRRPSLSERRERLRFVENLSLKKRGFYLWPTPSLLERGLTTSIRPSPRFQSHPLKKGQPLKREEFLSKLQEFGYEEAEIVELPGQFAARGSIVDYYSFLDELPLRLDLAGDVLESLSNFDPQTQLREDVIEEARLVRAREFLPEELSGFRTALKKYFLDKEYSVDLRESFLTLFEGPVIPLGLEMWSFLQAPNKQVLDANDFPIVFIEEAEIYQRLRTQADQLKRKVNLALSIGDCAPQTEDLFWPENEVTAHLKSLAVNADRYSLRVEPVIETQPQTRSADLLELSREWKSHSVEGFAHSLERILKTETILFVFQTLNQKERLEFLLTPYGVPFEKLPSELPITEKGFLWALGSISASFRVPEQNLVVISESSLLETPRSRSQPRRAKSSKEVFFRDIREGDLVVHQTHGVGQYLGLKTLHIGGQVNDLIEINYRDGKVFVPVQHLRLLHRYGGEEAADSSLDKLGGTTWKTKKERVKKEIAALAGELLNLYAQRAVATAPKIEPAPEDVHEFAASFPHDETPDQETAINAILQDLKAGTPMDRLLCGDVGYGKTEVALRAAHAVIAGGYQVALLCPTTLLTAQHERLFKQRLGEFGVKVAGLSRFCTDKEAREIIAQLKTGEISAVVGTHKLLSNDVMFKNLGLIVVDEEQRFGVIHKEKLKKLRTNAHVLSMTATPIPRTLSMALSGTRQFSVMTTPPQDRLSIKTQVLRKNAETIRQAIEFELKRGGQVFYLFNRVRGIEKVHEDLTKLVPSAKIDFAHGQMDETKLEEKMLRFYRGETQVLVTTTIIEAGLDVSNANTLIVENADNFGLSQLYQIRGRVGRSDRKAYAYLLLPESGAVSKDAEERLGILELYQELGSGFTIASHDLDLRGAGEILGDSQSGHLSLVGTETYFELLEETLADLKGENLERDFEPEVQIPIDTTIPNTYIKETGLRLSFYRRYSSCLDEESVDTLASEMEDRFGNLPLNVQHLVRVMKIMCALRRLRIRSLVVGKSGSTLIFDPTSSISREKLVERVLKYPQHFILSPDGKFVIRNVAKLGDDPAATLKLIDATLTQLEGMRI